MCFFSKPPVFKVNIHNLSQFVNHTVTFGSQQHRHAGRGEIASHLESCRAQ